MIYRENNEFKLPDLKVTYTQNGQEQTNFTSDKALWASYEELGYVSGVTFEEADYSAEQLARLEEVKDFPESEFPHIEDYVMNGIAAEGSQLFSKKRIEALEKSQLELADMLLGGLL